MLAGIQFTVRSNEKKKTVTLLCVLLKGNATNCMLSRLINCLQ